MKSAKSREFIVLNALTSIRSNSSSTNDSSNRSINNSNALYRDVIFYI